MGNLPRMRLSTDQIDARLGELKSWTRDGETIRRREPKSLPDLTEEERATYHAVCRPSDGLPPRVEQERIPLHVAVAVLPAAKQP